MRKETISRHGVRPRYRRRPRDLWRSNHQGPCLAGRYDVICVEPGSLVMLDGLANYLRHYRSGPKREALESLREYVGKRMNIGLPQQPDQPSASCSLQKQKTTISDPKPPSDGSLTI